MMRRMIASLVWVLAAIFVGMTWLVADPMVFPWRSTLLIGLVLTGALTTLAALRLRRRVLALALAGGTALAMWQGAAPRLDRALVLADGQDVGAIGRHFVVGYTDIDEVRGLARRGLIGGIFLTRRNVAGRSVQAIAAEIEGLQALRREARLPPLIVTADQEGGPVSHLSPPLAPPPALSTTAALPVDQGGAAARRLGRQQGADLRRLGITMDLAPVVDLTPSEAAGAFDRHTRIGTRSISGDPAQVAILGSAYAAGLSESGITPTAKHFPGLGRIATDTHLFGASLVASAASLEARDWVPFRAMLGVPGAAVMLSHVALDTIDPGVPASRSRRVVEGLLRQDWHFGGLAITDDLTMGAVAHAGLCRAVQGALNAGIDLLLVSWDIDKIYPALRCALAAEAAGQLDAAILAASAKRLDNHEKPW